MVICTKSYAKYEEKLLDHYIQMFKKRKTSLIRKICRFSKISEINNKMDATELKSKLRSLLKGLSEDNLQCLYQGLANRGGIETACINVKDSELRHFRRKYGQSKPRFLLAKAFRYSHLNTGDVIRRLQCCTYQSCFFESHEDECDGCINPFHSSLVVHTESPLPPYRESEEVVSATISSCGETSRTLTEYSVEPTGSSSSKPNSLGCSSSTPHCEDYCHAWSRILYWQYKNRIGRLFDIVDDSVNVFEDLPQGNGLCLSLLSQGIAKSDASDKVLKSIGYGFQLSKESDGVWLYNRSDIVLFTSSPTIQTESAVACPVVKRIPPGASVLVLDPNLITDINDKVETVGQSMMSFYRDNLTEDSGAYGNTKFPYCVRVSFGKGWGQNYTRISVTQCPCWVEIYLNIKVCLNTHCVN